MNELAVVILAAGQGTRMKSDLPKCLHQAAGRSLVEHVIRAIRPLEPRQVIVVIGYGAQVMREHLKDHEVTLVEQDFRTGYGTGHALMQAASSLAGFEGNVMVLNGDGPLLTTLTLQKLVERHDNQAGMTLLTCEVADPSGLGRIVRDAEGSVENIVEEKDASGFEKAIKEINPGIFLFDQQVFDFTRQLKSNNAANEYYITDLPGLYLAAGFQVRAELAEDEREVLGVNDRVQLAIVDRILRNRIKERWMRSGVTMIHPEQIIIDDSVILEPDSTIYPGVWLAGETVVRRGAVIEANAVLKDCVVEEGSRVKALHYADNEVL
jgi:bifunctional UDP-N-acetylglucosamine pyrophosphorylase/glucosamine-1-phosphate N-acetyltransferase